MSWSAGPARVRVPATSANLGPGFDTLGLALTLHDEVEARIIPDGLSVTVSGEGEQTAGDEERHLVVAAMRAAFGAMGGQPPGIALRCDNRIPHGRGLGSSAAAVVSGVLAARALVAGGADLLPGDDVLALAVDLEGHPDNVAACLAGGLTVAWRRPAPGGAPGGPPGSRRGAVAGADAVSGQPGLPPVGALRLPVVDGLSAVVCVAPSAMATRDARRALPGQVPHADAAANAARAALLVAALTRDPGVLFDATEDFLHQRYRASVMPDTADLLGRLRRAGVAAVVSGAGPSVLALTMAGQRPEPGVVDSIAKETGIGWHVIPLDVDRHGATVLPAGLGAHRPDTRQGRSFISRRGRSHTPREGPRRDTGGKLGDTGQSRECRGLLWC